MHWGKKQIVVMGALLLATALIYGPSARFGLIWDDPVWYGRAAYKSVGELVAPMPDFQFYRPGTMLYNAIFVSERGTVAPAVLHWVQIAWHLLNVALLAVLVRQLGGTRGQAAGAAALFAFHPFNYQAVAWAAPQQPMVMALLLVCWLTFLAARRRRSRKAAVVSVAVFAVALSIQEFVIAMAPIPLVLSVLWPTDEGSARGWRRRLARERLALTYPALATLYLLFWMSAPRAAGFTVPAWRPEVAVYLSQSIIYPLVGRPAGYDGMALWPQAVAASAAVAAPAILLLLANRAGRLPAALLGLIWALLAVLPALLGLRYSYVSVGSRLAYGAAAGIALLWSVALLPRQRGLGQWAGATMLAAIVVQSVWMLGGFNRFWSAGAALLDEMSGINYSHPSEQVFVNFPDRYAPRRAPYPVGYWGLTLAPVTVSLSDFTRRRYGEAHPSISLSTPWLDTVERASGPYEVDLRGSATTSSALYELVREGRELFVTRYDGEGGFELQRAGRVTAHGGEREGERCLATFGEAVCLQAMETMLADNRLEVVLFWQSLAPMVGNDTVFLHVARPEVPVWGQEDGDAWRGLLPLPLWSPGDTIEDQRTVRLPDALPAKDTKVNVGIYNRETGQRLPALDAGGQRLPMDAYTVVVGETE